MKKLVILNDKDNVATSLVALNAGDEVSVPYAEGSATILVNDAIEFGHKFAIRPLVKGDKVLKYGEIIGAASQDITVGDWVHTHNVESVRARGDKA